MYHSEGVVTIACMLLLRRMCWRLSSGTLCRHRIAFRREQLIFLHRDLSSTEVSTFLKSEKGLGSISDSLDDGLSCQVVSATEAYQLSVSGL